MISSQQLYSLVRDNPGRTVHELCAILDHEFHKSELNSRLYAPWTPFEWKPGRGNERRWYIADHGKHRDVTSVERLELYPWQLEALEWWRAHRSRGVVEAVTGAGKTRLALAAIAEQLDAGGPVVILVPTTELIHQWAREVENWLRTDLGLEFSIGILGNGRDDVERKPDVLITTVQSAFNHYLLPGRTEGLIVADEVHHYGAPRWSKALEPVFAQRLGLTGTYEREDSGLEEFLDPYFGNNLFEVDYERALEEDVIAHFKIAYVGVEFSPKEAEEHADSSDKAYRYRQKLINGHGLPEEPFGEFIKHTHILSQGGNGEATGLARGYLHAFSKCRQVLAGAEAKFDRVADLSGAIKKADKSIIFAQTNDAASEAIVRLGDKGLSGEVLDSSMDMHDRKRVFAEFEREPNAIVAAPRLLDEGIDVPDADLAIVLASNRSRRQLVQRLGRVIRKKDDRRLARLAVLYVIGTIEDPELGANQDFMYLVENVADDIKYFGPSTSSSRICSYLNDWSA